jgi:Mn2+/Fe2+ NRAMP family transporter
MSLSGSHNNMQPQKLAGIVTGAAFLMATSAIGPGFIIQTTVFTIDLQTSFAFVILVSIIIDIFVQLNIWRVLVMSGLRAQQLANRMLPGLGFVITAFVVFGGLAFNIGNIAGAGLGLNVITGWNVSTGAMISAVIAVAIFLNRKANSVMDVFAKLLGFVMIALTLYVAIGSNPPVKQAAIHSILPQKINLFAILTLVGGTVGGYISFAGAHRLLDENIKGKEALPHVNRGSVSGILIAGIMRVLLFLASIGVVTAGFTIDKENPAASVFLSAAGKAGYLIFGVVLWSAAITSVIGSAYTSVSFMRSLHPWLDKQYRWLIIVFIVFSSAVYLVAGRPVKVLVLAGAVNGMILPVTLAIILIGSLNRKVVGEYKHPLWLIISGWMVVILMTIMGIMVISGNL